MHALDLVLCQSLFSGYYVYNSRRWFKTDILSIITVSNKTLPIMITVGCCRSEFLGIPTAPFLLWSAASSHVANFPQTSTT